MQRIFYATQMIGIRSVAKGKLITLSIAGKKHNVQPGDLVYGPDGTVIGVTQGSYQRKAKSVDIEIDETHPGDTENAPVYDENDPHAMGWYEFYNQAGDAPAGWTEDNAILKSHIEFVARQYDFDDDRDIAEFLKGWMEAHENYVPF